MIGFRGADAPASPYAKEAFVKRSFLTSVAGLALVVNATRYKNREHGSEKGGNYDGYSER